MSGLQWVYAPYSTVELWLEPQAKGNRSDPISLAYKGKIHILWQQKHKNNEYSTQQKEPLCLLETVYWWGQPSNFPLSCSPQSHFKVLPEYTDNQ